MRTFDEPGAVVLARPRARSGIVKTSGFVVPAVNDSAAFYAPRTSVELRLAVRDPRTLRGCAA